MNAAVPERFNLTHYFLDRQIEEGRGGKTAVICVAGALTCPGVLRLVNQAGNCLARIGVQRGDRMLLILPDSPEFIAAYLGAIRIGAVAVPCNTALRATDYACLIAESEPKALVMHASYSDVIEPLSVSGAPVVVTGEPRAGCLVWNDKPAEQPVTLEPLSTAERRPHSGSGRQN